MASTPRLDLPFLIPGQAQKEATINEALQRLDMLVQGIVEDVPAHIPPVEPALGSCYLVSDGGAEAWAGMAGAIAAWTEGGWRFVEPREGLRMIVRQSGQLACFRDGAWQIGVVHVSEVKVGGNQVLSSRHPGISAPEGGSVVDVEARAALNTILAALRHHGLIAV